MADGGVELEDRLEAVGAGPPLAAPAETVAAEARMMTLLRGIHGLEREIRSRMSRDARV